MSNAPQPPTDGAAKDRKATHPPEDERYFRRGLGLRSEVRGEVDSEWCSDLVRRFKENGHVLEFGETRFELAHEFGFCYGVERSVDYAYETLKRFPDRRIVLTGEIIHNPRGEHATARDGHPLLRRRRDPRCGCARPR